MADPVQLMSMEKDGSILARMLFWGVIGSTLMVGVVLLWAYLKRAGKSSPTADIDVERIKQEMEIEAKRVLLQRKMAEQGEAEDASAAEAAVVNVDLNERVKQSLDGGTNNGGKS